MQRSESVGFLLRYLMYHLKSIEERLKWSKHLFKQQDKMIVGNAINKATNSVQDMVGIIRRESPQVVDLLMKDLNKSDLVHYMALTEQLYDLPSEDLEEITDLIDEYLKKKYPPQLGDYDEIKKSEGI